MAYLVISDTMTMQDVVNVEDILDSLRDAGWIGSEAVEVNGEVVSVG